MFAQSQTIDRRLLTIKARGNIGTRSVDRTTRNHNGKKIKQVDRSDPRVRRKYFGAETIGRSN